MESSDVDKLFSVQHIEKLNDTNYRPWSIKVKAILRAKKLLSIVDGSETGPSAPAEGDQQNEASAAALESFTQRKITAAAFILSTVSSSLITYIEDHDEDPAQM